MPSYRPENSANLVLATARGWVLLLLVALVSACAPEIGDDCTNALDCSASASRLCDLTQPGGYCTVLGCEEKTCPEEAVCVQFGRRIEGRAVDRLARSYCMYRCGSRDDCRADEGYDCFSARSFGGMNEAQVLGDSSQKFCAPLAPRAVASRPRDAGVPEDAAMSMPEDDAGMSLPDAGADAAVDAMMSLPDDDGGA